MAKKKDRATVRIPQALAHEVSDFLLALGSQFVKMSNASGAFDCFKYSVDLRPENQPAVYNLGILYGMCGDPEGSCRMLKEASRMNPKDTTARIAYAEACRRVGQLSETERVLGEVLGSDPNHPSAASAMAILMYDQCRLAEAGEWNARAIELNPKNTGLRLNEALLNMVYGKWREWWPTYEVMLSYQPHNGKMKGLRIQDSWQGQPCPGQTLLVISDQGAGDCIQFGRFIGKAREKGQFGKVIYAVPQDLKSLIEKFEGIDEVVAFGERERQERDQFSSLLGIMRVLQVDPEDARIGSLVLKDASLEAVWKSRIDREAEKPGAVRVALCWAGDRAHGNDHNRSMPLAALAPVTDLPGFEFFSFQVGPAAAQCSVLGLPEVGSQLTSYLDTAHALRQIDLLVTVDTSIAHLAGILGVRTMLLLPSVPEWRWMLSRKDSVWYDSVEIFRQAKLGEWGPVVGAVRKRLEEDYGGKNV